MDVHKDTVAACVLVWEAGGARKEKRIFGTTTQQLLELSDWLHSQEVTHVAMESRGVYWKPIWNILEGPFDITLVNAHHFRSVPGRKTDLKEGEWIGDLLQPGLLRKSFVPEKPIRELRDLTRSRAMLAREKVRLSCRIQKVLEDANIKRLCARICKTPRFCWVSVIRTVGAGQGPDDIESESSPMFRGF